MQQNAIIKTYDELRIMLPIKEFAENGKANLSLAIKNEFAACLKNR